MHRAESGMLHESASGSCKSACELTTQVALLRAPSRYLVILRTSMHLERRITQIDTRTQLGVSGACTSFVTLSRLHAVAASTGDAELFCSPGSFYSCRNGLTTPRRVGGFQRACIGWSQDLTYKRSRSSLGILTSRNGASVSRLLCGGHSSQHGLTNFRGFTGM